MFLIPVHLQTSFSLCHVLGQQKPFVPVQHPQLVQSTRNPGCKGIPCYFLKLHRKIYIATHLPPLHCESWRQKVTFKLILVRQEDSKCLLIVKSDTRNQIFSDIVSSSSLAPKRASSPS